MFVGDWKGVDLGRVRGGEGLALESYNARSDDANDLSKGLEGWPLDLCILESEYGRLTVSYAKS